MAINLVTGYAGVGHVTSADEGCFNAGLCGLAKYALSTGERLSYSLESNNKILIKSGDLVNQGRHINIPYGTYETLNIENGTQGKSRIDIVAMHYNRNISTGVETASLKIIKGTESATNPQLPAIVNGNIFSGDLEDDMPLYYIHITDLNIVSVQQAFTFLPTLDSICDLIYPIGSIYMSVNTISPSLLFGGEWSQIKDRFLLSSGKNKVESEGGEENHLLTVEEMPSHLHKIPKHGHSASAAASGKHNHVSNRSQIAASGTARYAAQYSESSSHLTGTAGEHSHTITVNQCAEFNSTNTGGNLEHNNMPPYFTVNIWKRIG